MKKSSLFCVSVICLLALAFPAGGNVFARASAETGFTIVSEKGERELAQSDLTHNLTEPKKKLLSLPTQKALKTLENMGFDDGQSIAYLFDNLFVLLEQISGEVEEAPVCSTLQISGEKAVATPSKIGKKVDTQKVVKSLALSLKNGETSPRINLETVGIMPDITQEKLALCTNLKAEFETDIRGVNQEGRICNIGLALSKFNGLILNDGESFSFNKIIGETTAENGYKPAKVILNGKYEDDYGGGVCQAATTVYNACLLAGLEILEVNPHSLQVGYVKGAFDAMVAPYVSDLKVKNNSGAPVIFFAEGTSGNARVKVFGLKNNFRLVRRSEKKEFDALKEPTVKAKYEGFLDYYDGDNLVKSERIRRASYFKKKAE